MNFDDTYSLKGLPWWLSGKYSAGNAGAAGDAGSMSGSGRSPGGGHSSVLAWRIPWTELPGQLQRLGLPKVGYKSSHLACLYTHTHTHIARRGRSF